MSDRWAPLWKRLPPELKAGERVRLTPGGPVLEVVRVTQGAAYVGRKVTGKPFEAFDKATREYKLVPGIEKTVTEAISLHALVERVTGEEDAGGEG